MNIRDRTLEHRFVLKYKILLIRILSIHSFFKNFIFLLKVNRVTFIPFAVRNFAKLKAFRPLPEY